LIWNNGDPEQRHPALRRGVKVTAERFGRPLDITSLIDTQTYECYAYLGALPDFLRPAYTPEGEIFCDNDATARSLPL
jgi:hypothetical protein